MFAINAALRMSPRVIEPPRADASAKPFRIGAMFTTNAPAARRELWRCGVGPVSRVARIARLARVDGRS